MSNVMAAQPHIGAALCESSIIPFLILRHKLWLTPAARVQCSNAANIGEFKTWRKVNFAPGKILSGGKSLQKCIYNAAAQKTAKDGAKFCWPSVSNVAAVTKPRRETS